ncbi:MAG: hypothetical protein WA197_01155 [Candidatus Acidiferrales bacterium]
MTKNDRRAFLNDTSIAAIGTAAALGAASAQSLAARPAPAAGATASFGWEVSLKGNGANIYFRVAKDMILNTVNIDVAFMILSLSETRDFAEVLCQACVSRGVVPSFDNNGGHAYTEPASSPDFDSATIYNPNRLELGANTLFGQDVFFSVILKGGVPHDGSGSAQSRQALMQPALPLKAGDYLVFHMDHAGVKVDAEMQVVLGYTLT